jgi:uncharacterized membrane protein
MSAVATESTRSTRPGAQDAAVNDPRARSVRRRVESVDFVRGVIMVIMALDHTRDFFGIPGDNPTDLSRASTALFLTRWVTHFCAPVFFLLTGTGACLSLEKKTKADLSRFLVTRGAWLILLEVTVLRCFAYQFNVDYHVTMLIVLWALGWAMIVLSLLVWLPTPIVLAFGVVLIAGHDALDSVESTNPLWTVLHSPGFIANAPGHAVRVVYTLVPWIGVTAVGYALGATYRWDAARRRSLCLAVGIGATAAFLVVRGLDAYGDPSPWAHQGNALRTMLSFLNTTKYPPSLAFLLMTLGPPLLLLGATDGHVPARLRFALVFGKVPLFYYAVHFFLIHLLAVVVCAVRTGSAHYMFESPDLAHYPFSPPPGWGFSLPVVYAIWALVVATMYVPSRWFAGVKARRRDAWLSYL